MVTWPELAAGIVIIILFGGLFANIFGLPGTVLLVLAGLVYGLVTGFATINLKILGILCLMSLVAEIGDFLMGLTPGFYLGPSLRGTVAALVGAIVGMSLLTPKFMVVGTVLGLYFGGFLGLLSIEIWHQLHLKPLFRAGVTSILKRVGGGIAKGAISVAMVLIVLTNMYS